MSVSLNVMPHQISRSQFIPRQVLIIDDDVSGAALLKEGLEKIPNCQIQITGDSEQALQHLQSTPVDLLITDLQMPKMDGLTLIRQLRIGQPSLPVIMITGYSELIPVEEAKTLSINHILDKPVKLAKIRTVVSDLLR
ncbi:MAG: response regulator [Chloroflexota bacterium]